MLDKQGIELVLLMLGSQNIDMQLGNLRYNPSRKCYLMHGSLAAYPTTHKTIIRQCLKPLGSISDSARYKHRVTLKALTV